MWFRKKEGQIKLHPYSFMHLEDGVFYMQKDNAEEQEADESFRSLNSDPWFLFHLPKNCTEIYIQFEMVEKLKGLSYLYFGYEEDKGAIQPTNRLYLDVALCVQGVRIAFEKPVSVLRFDPTDQEENFAFKTLMLGTKSPQAHVIQAQEDRMLLPFERSLEKCKEQLQKANAPIEKIVLLVTHEMDYLGASQLCYNLAKELKTQGYFPICLALEEGPAAHLFVQNSTWLFLAKKKDLPAQEQVINAMASLGIKKAICNTVLAGCCVPFLQKSGIETISLIHEMRGTIEICAAEEYAQNIATYANTVVFPNKEVLKDFETVTHINENAKIEILPQGLYKKAEFQESKQRYKEMLCQKYHLSNNSNVLVCAGAINFGKGVDLLPFLLQEMYIEDMPIAKQTHIFWLGKATEQAFFVWLKNQIEKMGQAKQIHFIGQITDTQEYYSFLAGADAFLQLSREDSMPSALMEAMYCETPAIAFCESGGAQELLGEGRGKLVPYMDVKELAQQIIQTIKLPQKQNAQTLAAKEYIQKNTSFTAYVEKLMGLF